MLLGLVGFGVVVMLLGTGHVFGREGSKLFGLVVLASMLLVPILVATSPVASGVATAATAVLAVAVFAVAVFLVSVLAFVSYLMVLCILTGLLFLVFVPMRALHWVWLIYRKIAYRCPYDACSYSGLPVHVCTCGQEYADLRPSFYGIFYHTCRHRDGDVKLPTLNLLGRKRLVRLCGKCKYPLGHSSFGELSEIPILLVGGTNTGKSVFLRQAVRGLRDALATRFPGAQVALDSRTQEHRLQEDFNRLDKGQVLDKTTGDVVEACGVALRLKKPRLHSLLYLYDPPGDDFSSMQRLGGKQSLHHLQGFFLLVDPFASPGLKRVGTAADAPDLKVSQAPLSDVVRNLIVAVNQHLVAFPTQRCSVPIAVVINKVDALPAGSAPCLAALAAQNGAARVGAPCRQTLEDLGEGPSLRNLELKFSTVEYFACSALGRAYDPREHTPFRPQGVEAPLIWLIERAIFQREGALSLT
jgi:hypothetical protein